ncbi:MAG: hypothetical protein JW384_00627 [Nitrosomonadaceae bacterium]|nr:hypothetical protein [Nitrosomonadaceae bacterium]
MKKITKCRISGDTNLISVLNLGDQELTGVFPKSPTQKVNSGPLELVWSRTSRLLQLSCSFEAGDMYGENYGYRSGLNQSMVTHLTNKISYLESKYGVAAGDCVIDIGSNDATSLKAYKTPGLRRIGVDPTGSKFAEYYPADIKLIADFFPAPALREAVGNSRAKIITSIAMFYDLDDPVAFAQNIADTLDKDGVWHLEQSYMPSMLKANSYDTICHEHIEYYSLSNIRDILERANLRVIEVQMNDVNGGSFAITVAHKNSRWASDQAVIEGILQQEVDAGYDSPTPFREFESRVYQHRKQLLRLLQAIKAEGKTIFGYGASTKGNVLLQFCGLTEREITAVADVNPDKFGCYTPGSRIPIVSEAEARLMKPDYYLVLPWHFRAGILQREQQYLVGGGRFIFPFPEIQVV